MILNSSSTNASLRTLAELVKLDFQDLYLKWGANQPPRSGLHASSLLVADTEWCMRKHVLEALFADEAIQPELKQWQWKQFAIFENGWDLHRCWQKLFLKHGNVVMGRKFTASGFFPEPELDLTHFDPDRQVFFSPDAILQVGDEELVVEIKGINHDAYQSLSSSLEQAMASCETVHKAVVQANLYMHLLDLKHAVILIENKNNQEFRVWITEYDRELALPYIQRAYSVKGAVTLARANGTFPQRVCQSPEDPLARKCPMCKKCFSEI